MDSLDAIVVDELITKLEDYSGEVISGKTLEKLITESKVIEGK